MCSVYANLGQPYYIYQKPDIEIKMKPSVCYCSRTLYHDDGVETAVDVNNDHH